MVKINPLQDRVVVKRSEVKDRTEGGILLPDTAKDSPKQGTVVAVGPGKVLDSLDSPERQPVCVKIGDTVLFTNYAGNEVEVSGEKFLILSEHDILATLIE